jgi:hypothetical protein
MARNIMAKIDDLAERIADAFIYDQREGKTPTRTRIKLAVTDTLIKWLLGEEK